MAAEQLLAPDATAAGHVAGFASPCRLRSSSSRAGEVEALGAAVAGAWQRKRKAMISFDSHDPAAITRILEFRRQHYQMRVERTTAVWGEAIRIGYTADGANWTTLLLLPEEASDLLAKLQEIMGQSAAETSS